MRTRAHIFLFAGCLLLAAPGAAQAADLPQDFRGWWMTPDQQGRRLFEQERYLEAAAVFSDAGQKGVAFYRGGDFESAAAVFGRIRTPQAAYNRGNALVMLGRYDEAIESYEKALEEQAGWKQAEENLAIARARKALLAPPDTDSGGTGGQLGADEIVFDDTGRVNEGGTETQEQGGDALSEEEMRAAWLRRVQNDPSDFLASRFAYQLYRDQQEEADDAQPE